MKLADSVNTEVVDGRIVQEPPYVEYLRSQGYKIEGVDKVRYIESSSQDGSHMLCEIQTYGYPMGHDKLDIAAHGVSLKVCSCRGYQYTHGIDVSERPLKETSAGTCPHLNKAYRAEKAASDPNQESL